METTAIHVIRAIWMLKIGAVLLVASPFSLSVSGYECRICFGLATSILRMRYVNVVSIADLELPSERDILRETSAKRFTLPIGARRLALAPVPARARRMDTFLRMGIDLESILGRLPPLQLATPPPAGA